MLKKYFLFSALIIISNFGFAQSISLEQIKQTEISVNAFMAALEIYSECNGNGWLHKQILVTDLHDSQNDKDGFFNDLFSFQPENTNSESDWGQYLSSIHVDFNNNIQIAYSNINVIDCVVKSSTGDRFIYVSVDKSLSFKTQNPKYKILVVVNVDKQFRINEVVSPQSYKAEPGNTCNIGIDNTDVAKQITTLINLADDYFAKKEYAKASSIYQAVLDKFPTNLSIKTKLEECLKKGSYTDFLNKADNDFNSNKFEVAKNQYNKIKNDFEDADKTYLNKRIQDCNKGIAEQDFKKNVDLGDYYFAVANFATARMYYSNAHLIKPDDQSIINKIAKAKNGDKSFVLGEIERAEKMAERNKKNDGEVFKILAQYEQSGLLKTLNYIFLTMAMEKTDSDVKNVMNYTNRDCANYLSIYTKKLQDAVDAESDAGIKAMGEKILFRVIPKRYLK